MRCNRVEEYLLKTFNNPKPEEKDDPPVQEEEKAADSLAANLASAVATGTDLKSILKQGNIFKR